ncbi:MAG TPA: hypothetical protein VE077_06450 [Candidatus Methylomirabilis sp.]|nr:hypothetical protein [Candidatus Methylomirabilis sp.]
MLTPQSVLRFTIELIFVLLGAIVVWLGLTGRVMVERHKPSWFILSAALILWGLRALYGSGKWWARWENWTRGLSLILLGLVMLAISRVPFLWIGPLLIAAGIVMALRGIIGAALVFRPR